MEQYSKAKKVKKSGAALKPGFEEEALPVPEQAEQPGLIMEQARANPRSLTADRVLQLQSSVGNQAVQRLLAGRGTPAGAAAIQRRVNQVPQADDITAVAPAGSRKVGTYGKVLQAIRNYYDNGRTPAADYGQQLYQLYALNFRIGEWETKRGSVDQDVQVGCTGISRDDKRRRLLKALKGKVALENTGVQQQGKVAADAAHALDRAKLLEYVREGALSADRRLSNSCEWILSGRTKLFAVTPTGDSYARLDKADKDPDEDEAFFPQGETGSLGDINGAAVSYQHTDLTNNTNVLIKEGGKITGGWNQPGHVAVAQVRQQPKSVIFETIRHEVQHDADQNRGRENLAGVRAAGIRHEATGVVWDGASWDFSRASGDQRQAAKAAMGLAEVETAWRKYKTEYRAYSYQEGDAASTFTNLDNSAQDQLHGGQQLSARQLAVLKHLYKDYDYVKINWDANPLLGDGRTFRQAVAAYWNPDTEGFNKYNSVRVDAFYRALDAAGTKEALNSFQRWYKENTAAVSAAVSDANDVGVQAVLVTVNALKKEDAVYIRTECPAMLRKIDTHLAGAARVAVNDALAAKAT